MRNRISIDQFEFLDSLSFGDRLEVLDKENARKWQGVVEEVAPYIGVLWVRTVHGERKMVDIRSNPTRRVSKDNSHTLPQNPF
jgi:hypothetical protein